ncbi:MAG TPA: steroid 5-alpha reductase [Cyanobacteria bacterium UBA11149]|nr:steroid 5-alpha reductase [Cyanobacteria bacterium UBA11367]HBE56910.1 steroid 5-alpha reductase [Cyanobacteria bacterium UBA11366]HBK64099.1 steroid 5-alpha reductase [Cyanobacteria bacterium UBA11166]HBR75293.1 steroid 5-alpha reductase [Cyanobacteria bacterium UBA11159]HBS72389.1 steroid 5-alpha reductase [Cyanobacteria bacterium UBA11153]HBW91475.1 steroid 5-alpha reductase [Cyanobacteria bacterium UBA11149]HCA98207.1 steroid 5-alpha reductase [Cyanobacteria bacterium UBA9226]
MENTANSAQFQITQLTAINIAKALTILVLIALAIVFGISDFRQILYLCLHVSYCLWWLLEQWFYPLRRQQLFREPVGIGGFIASLLLVGLFYSLPGYLAFVNPDPISLGVVALALPLFIFGSLINGTADIQKMTAKQYGVGLVKDGIWRFSRNINYFGDLLRYLSFSIVAGSIWAYLVPVLMALLYIQRIFQKEQSMSQKYQDYEEYAKSSSRLIPFIW